LTNWPPTTQKDYSMPDPNPAALEFLLNRRSRPAKTLRAPAPSAAELLPILTAAARTPDHGKLEPWRFIVLQAPALRRLGALVAQLAQEQALDADAMAKAVLVYETSPLAVAVIESPKVSQKIPPIEQTYSAGAVCLAMVNAALASGWGANWLSGWPIYTDAFKSEGLDLAAHESVAGLIHIGTESAAPPERPRPDIDAITTWVEA